MAKKKQKAATRKPRGKQAEQDNQPQAGGGDGADAGGPKKSAIGLIAGSVLRTLMKSCLSIQKTISDASGDMGELVSKAATEKNLHKGAFADCKKLYRMGKKDPSKLWLHLAHFDHMRKELGLDELAATQEQAFGPGTGDQNETEADEAEQERAQSGRTGAAVRDLKTATGVDEDGSEPVRH